MLSIISIRSAIRLLRVFLRAFVAIGCMIICVGVTSTATAKSEYENPPALKASKILLAAIISGPHHRVDDKVFNDGYINTYSINSPFGQFKAVSSAMLPIRVHEVNAIAAMEEVKKSKEYGESVKEAAVDIGEGAKALITRPKAAISGSITGIGKLFQRGAESLFQSKPGQYEDSRAKSLIDFSKTKRDYANDASA